jgi:phage FluMu protein Com
MNLRCTICNAVIAGARTGDRCPDCGARPRFQVPTRDAPRHAEGAIGEAGTAWEFSPDGPILRRFR